jgi:hypothetical protein
LFTIVRIDAIKAILDAALKSSSISAVVLKGDLALNTRWANAIFSRLIECNRGSGCFKGGLVLLNVHDRVWGNLELNAFFRIERKGILVWFKYKGRNYLALCIYWNTIIGVELYCVVR